MKEKVTKRNITVKEYKRLKALGLLGLINTDVDPRTIEERYTFINNPDEIQHLKLKEYNVWYTGDGDEILNFYTRANSIDFNYDPMFNRGKKGYFWAEASTESDIKRTHSGQPRNIVDTLCGIVGTPRIGVGKPNAVLEPVNKKLQKILADNNFNSNLTQRARPMTLVEGWGGWKINWNTDFRDTPILLYYRADACDFFYRGNELRGIIYEDYYQDEKANNYILFETRYLEKREIKTGVNAGLTLPCLVIDKELFKISGTSDVLTPVDMESLPQLADTQTEVVVENFTKLLGGPNVYYADSTGDLPGRSIFTGKLDLFDDLDQCLSQAANSVRRSTPTEVWDVNFLERDKNTGMPVMPHAYDRKYISFQGTKSGEGNTNRTPVQTTQPNIDFEQYDREAIAIIVQILNGVMSPATLGLDLGKTEKSGESAREKEKVTIFTRNGLIETEQVIIKNICEQLLMADELMHQKKVTCEEYDVYVKYNEFADASVESKMETVATAYQNGLMTPEMAVDYLYGCNISKEDRDSLIKYMKEQKEKDEQSPYSDEELGEMGEELGGMNNNPYDEAQEKLTQDNIQEKSGVPELTNYNKLHNRKMKTDLEKETLAK